MGISLFHRFLQLRRRLSRGLRADSPEIGVAPIMKDRHFRAGIPEELIQVAARRAVKGIHDHTQVGLADHIHVDMLPQCCQIIGTRIKQLHHLRSLRLLPREPFDVLPVQQVKKPLFDSSGGFRKRRASPLRCKLDAVIFWRVMTGGNIHPAGQVVLEDVVRNGRSGCFPITQQHRHAVARKHFSRGLRKFFTKKPGIIADDQASVPDLFLFQDVDDGLTDHSDVLKRKVFPQNGSPP